MRRQRDTRASPWPERCESALSLVREGFDLAWPSSCVGCGAWGPVWCAVCDRSSSGWAHTVRPTLAPHLAVDVAARFEGPLRVALTAFKDAGRRDAGPLLGALAREAVAEAIATRDAARACAAELVLVPVPSSRSAFRRRGRAPLNEIAALVRRGTRLRDGSDLLRHGGRVHDQSRMALAQRRDNVAGAFEARAGSVLSLARGDAWFILLDDVVTSGATLAAAHAALQRAGARTLVCAAIAATPRRP